MGKPYYGFIGSVKAIHREKQKPNTQQVNSFLKGTRNQLIKTKKPVYVYCQFQLDKLISEFGDRLIYEYDENNNWWKCHLKKEGKQC